MSIAIPLFEQDPSPTPANEICLQRYKKDMKIQTDKSMVIT